MSIQFRTCGWKFKLFTINPITITQKVLIKSTTTKLLSNSPTYNRNDRDLPYFFMTDTLLERRRVQTDRLINF